MAKARLNRDDKGVRSFIKDFMTTVIGIQDETANDLISRVRERGEWSGLKSHIRQLSGDVYKRFNTAIDMAEDQVKEEPEEDEDEGQEEKAEDKKDDKKEEKKEDVKEGYTFIKHLLNEVTLDVDLDDPTKSVQAVKRAARLGGERVNREQRKDVKQELKDIDPSSKTAAIDKQIAMTKQRLLQLQQKRSRITGDK